MNRSDLLLEKLAKEYVDFWQVNMYQLFAYSFLQKDSFVNHEKLLENLPMLPQESFKNNSNFLK